MRGMSNPLSYLGQPGRAILWVHIDRCISLSVFLGVPVICQAPIGEFFFVGVL